MLIWCAAIAYLASVSSERHSRREGTAAMLRYGRRCPGEKMSLFVRFLIVAPLLLFIALGRNASASDEVKTDAGLVAGTTNADGSVRIFKGIPFAAPPIGSLRWKAPQPAPRWTGVRQADKFGSACLQNDVFGDIYFRDSQP